MSCGILLLLLVSLVGPAWGASDPFPAYEEAPAYTTYFVDGVPNNVYHIRTTGNDSTGDGSYENAWASLAGGQGTIAAGDLILYHEGTYSSYTNGPDSSWSSDNQLTTDGTSSDHIVIMAANKYTGYTSEITPVISSKGYLGMTLYGYQVLDGITFQGGLSIFDTTVVVQNCDFSVGSAGQRDGNPAMILFPSESPYAQNVTIRNNSFHDPANDHDNGNGRCYAIVMFESNTTDGTTWNDGYTRIKYNKFYNFDAPTSQKFIIYCKDLAHGVETSFNRFYNSNAFATAGYGQGNANTLGWQVHDNLVYNCDGLGIYWGEGISGEWYNNVVIDDGYSSTAYYMGQAAGWSYGLVGLANSHLCANAWGEVWNNIFAVDDPGEWYDGTDASGYGYWNWVDYNAYVSTTIRDRFENANGGSANWQQHAQTTEQTITVDANYFCTVADDYPYKTSGKDSDCIGGFIFSGSTPTGKIQGVQIR